MKRFAIYILFLCSSFFSHASIEDEIDTYFNTMTTVVPPTASTTASGRGVITGGSLSFKAQQASPNLVSFVPPSVSAGCNGIDINMGSFSFISKSEAIDMLRNIAAAAPGYAFSIAMKSMCGSCLSEMKSIAAKARQMSRYLGDACRVVKGIKVQKDESGNDRLALAADMQQIWSGADDVSGAMDKSDTSKDTVAQADAAGGFKECTFDVNLFWCFAKDNNFLANWNGGDDNLLLDLMALFGSTIVGGNEDYTAPDGQSVGKTTPEEVIDHTIDFDDLLYAKDTDVTKGYACANGVGRDECTSVIERDVYMRGLVQRIQETFVDGPNSIVVKTHDNSTALTVEQKNLRTNLPFNFGTLVTRLAVKDVDAANEFVGFSAPIIARHIIEDIIKEFIQAVEQIKVDKDLPYYSAYKDAVEKRVEELRKQIESSKETIPKPHEMISLFWTYEGVLKKSKYLNVDALNGVAR